MGFQVKEIQVRGTQHPQHKISYKEQKTKDIQREDGHRVSEEEYWEKYYEYGDVHYEWNNGILEEKPVSDYEAYLMSFWFTSLIHHFLDTYPIAKVIGLEMGFRLNLSKKVTIRKPDIGVILNSNSIGIKNRDRTFQGIVDMCIEILSDSTRKEIERDTKAKKQEYCQIKVKEYYVLDRKQNHTAFYHLASSGRYNKIKPTKDS
ncbi:MAG: Uma2 family endonuclease [Desulfobacterales bacterium]|nr:Uma2 family endonuclease [Desulfobacterales bacterium]